MDCGYWDIRDGYQYPRHHLRGPHRPAVRINEFCLAIQAWRAWGRDQPVNYRDPGRQYLFVQTAGHYEYIFHGAD
jgi:hypothetical protein